MKIYTIGELKEVIYNHMLWLQDGDEGVRADLRNADLSYADLRNANLSYANLRNANLRNADLRNANLRNADLRNADLRYADLRYADLRNADLSYADLSNADLSNADLSYADLINANLSYANLRNANLRNADLILVGQDIRGYLFWSFVGDSGVVEIRAGCRHFVGISAARAHWTERHRDDEVLHEDCLSLVDRCERMATVRGWKLEPEAK